MLVPLDKSLPHILFDDYPPLHCDALAADAAVQLGLHTEQIAILDCHHFRIQGAITT